MFVDIIRDAYKPYEYLLGTGKLKKREIEEMEHFLYAPYDKFVYIELIIGLNVLAKILYYYFNERRCVLLVDDYDSMLLEPSHVTRDEKICESQIAPTLSGMLHYVLKRSPLLVGYAFLTGISWTSNYLYYADLDIVTYAFADDSQDGFEETDTTHGVDEIARHMVKWMHQNKD